MTNQALTPTQKIQHWLAELESTLQSDQPQKAAELFEENGFWRDLVALTWNIKTVEGRQSIRDMLGATAASAHPHDWKVDGEATEADGLTEAWLTFKTNAAKCEGQIRRRNGKCWTLLTAMTELRDPKSWNLITGAQPSAPAQATMSRPENGRWRSIGTAKI